jgi:WD40 repeat protein
VLPAPPGSPSIAAVPEHGVVVRGQGPGGDEFCLLDVALGIELHRWPAPTANTLWAVTPDGRHLITAEERALRIFDLQTRREARVLTGHTDQVSSFTATNAQVFSAAADDTLRVWDIESGSQVRILESDSASTWDLAVTADGHRAISREAHSIFVWNVAGEGWTFSTTARPPRAHSSAVTAIAASSAAPFALSGSPDSNIKLWSIEQVTGTAVPDTETTGSLVALALSPDGATAVRASSDAEMTVWRPAENRPLGVLKADGGQLSAFAVRADFEFAVAAANDFLSVWNLTRGERTSTRVLGETPAGAVLTKDRLAYWTSQSVSINVLAVGSGQISVLTGHTEPVCCLVATLDGRTLLSGSLDRTVKIWNLENGELRRSLSLHAGRVNALAVSPSGDRAVSVSDDQTLKLFDLNTGSVIAGFTADAPLLCCAFASDGVTVLAGDMLGNVHFLALAAVGSGASKGAIAPGAAAATAT